MRRINAHSYVSVLVTLGLNEDHALSATRYRACDLDVVHKCVPILKDVAMFA